VNLFILSLGLASSFLLGFGLGGYVAYRLIMNRMKSRVTSMFDFGDAGSLLDEITEVKEDE